MLDIRLTQPRRGPDQNRVKSQSKLPFHAELLTGWLATGLPRLGRAHLGAYQAKGGVDWSKAGICAWFLHLGPTSAAQHARYIPCRPVGGCVLGVLCRVARFTSRYSEMIVLYQGARKALPHHQ